MQYGNLIWGAGGKSKACNSKCPKGWVTLSKNSHITGQKSGCKSGRYAPLCAFGLLVQQNSDTCYSSFTSHILSGGHAQRPDLDELFEFGLVGGPSNFAFGRSPERKSKRKHKRSEHGGDGCGGALPMDALGMDIPATWAYHRLGDNYAYRSLEATTLRVTEDHQSTTSPSASVVKSSTTVTVYSTGTRTCNGRDFKHACWHYSSVAMNQGYSLVTCKNKDVSRSLRPQVYSYNQGHQNRVWFSYLASSYQNHNGARKKLNCQRDEFPPSHFQQGERVGWIRLLPNDQNSNAANLRPGVAGWKGFCKYPPHKSVAKAQGGPIVGGVITEVVTTFITLNVMSYTWTSVSAPAGDPQGLSTNPCYPSVLTADVGFALMTDDPWYQGVHLNDYNFDPGMKTKGKVKPNYKRDSNFPGQLDYVDGNIIVDDGNSSRHVLDEELEDLGYARCATPDCEMELERLRDEQAEVGLPTQALPMPTAEVTATVTPTVRTTSNQAPAPKLRAASSQPTAAFSDRSASSHMRRHRARHGHQHGH